jgi:putative sterol carrier protein
VPPNWDLRYTREYGFELEDIYAFGIRSVRAKWRATGYPIEEMPAGVFPLDPDLPEREIARRQIVLLRAGVMGEPNLRPQSGLEVQQIYFDLVAHSVDREATDGRPLTIQWRSADADDWHLVVDNGSSRARPGAAPGADIVLETTWKDWLDISMHGLAPWRAMLQRRLRPRGSPAKLMQMKRLFPRRPALA